MDEQQAKQLKPVIILFIVLFLVMVGFGIILPILPFLIKKLGGGPIALGLFMTVYSLMQFFFAPFWGRLSDRIGRRPVLLIGLAGYGISFILFGFVHSLWVLIAIRGLGGILSSAALPTAMAYLADISVESERSKGMGIIGAAMSLGMVFGPVLGGWFGQDSFSRPFFLAGGLALLVMPFAVKFLPETLHRRTLTESFQKEEFSYTLPSWHVLKEPLFIFFAFTFAMNFTMALFESTFVLLAADRVGLGPRQLGIVFAVLGLVGAVVQGGLIGKLSKIFGDTKLINFGAFLSAVGLIAVLYSNHRNSLILSSALVVAGGSLIGPAVSSLITARRTENKGTSLGVMHSYGSLGRIFGPITGGILYGLNISFPYYSGAALMIFMVLLGERLFGHSELKEGSC